MSNVGLMVWMGALAEYAVINKCVTEAELLVRERKNCSRSRPVTISISLLPVDYTQSIAYDIVLLQELNNFAGIIHR